MNVTFTAKCCRWSIRLEKCYINTVNLPYVMQYGKLTVLAKFISRNNLTCYYDIKIVCCLAKSYTKESVLPLMPVHGIARRQSSQPKVSSATTHK